VPGVSAPVAGIFERDGDVYVPSDNARGPWIVDSLHGGATAALLARAVETVPTYQPMRIVRMTVELFRTAPCVPMIVRVRPVRDGRRIQLVEASMFAAGRDDGADGPELARMMALRIREAEGLVPDDLVPETWDDDEPPPFPDESSTITLPDGPFYFVRNFEIRAGDDRHAFGGSTWLRLHVPLVAGEPTSPMQRLAAATDLLRSASEGLGRLYTSANPDLTIHVTRSPVGEWLCLGASVRFGADGIGQTDGEIWDGSGRVGRGVKSLLIEPR
jgi:Thioesterase-like superfamily